MTDTTSEAVKGGDAKPTAAAAGWRDVITALGRPKVLTVLALGFASGLPFLLTGNTLGLWLRGEGWELTAIGFLSWVGLAYTMKWLWAPVVDKMSFPLLGRLGRRRSWLAASQIAIGLGLLGMALVGPHGGIAAFALMAVVVAFASATQDIVADAYRIERAADDEELGLLTAAFQLGYRAALLIADSLIIIAASRIGWDTSYIAMAAIMTIGLLATFRGLEPQRQEAEGAAAASGPLWTLRGLFDAVAGPFIAFFREHKQLALLMLVAVCLYRLADFVMGPMAGPLYVDLGYTGDQIGTIRFAVGLPASLVGIALAGLSAVRLGFTRTLLLGAVLGPASNLAFSVMALAGKNVAVFGAAIFVDNLSTGYVGAALVAYMSSLTSFGYTATQYALLSSSYAFLGKFLKGFSGQIVDWLSVGRDLMHAYAIFFFGTALVGLPALLLCWFLARATAKKAAEAAA